MEAEIPEGDVFTCSAACFLQDKIEKTQSPIEKKRKPAEFILWNMKELCNKKNEGVSYEKCMGHEVD